MPVVQVFYISRCAPAVTPTDVRRIVGSSQLRNRRRQLTGLLAYSGRHFAQVVEGSATEVDELLRSIAADSRHTEMKVLQRLEGVPRQFENWSMHLLDSMSRADQIEGLFETEAGPFPKGAAVELLLAIAADAEYQRSDDMMP